MLIIPNKSGRDDRKLRFLNAYRERPEISWAARLAAVHRATVYRWMTDPAFTNAMTEARNAYYRERRAYVLADEGARRQWRAERERARRPMRCQVLALARAAKRRIP